MTLLDPIFVAQLVADAFDRLNIPYLIGGSLASSLHGIPRTTQDVDLVADIKVFQIPLLVASLESAFYADAEMMREAIQRRASFNLIHLATMLKIDVFILKKDPLSQTEMARRQCYEVEDRPDIHLFLASVEDTIVRKLEWYRLGGETSERQWRDMLGVIEVQQKNLEFDYLFEAADQCGVTDLLQRAFRDAGVTQSNT